MSAHVRLLTAAAMRPSGSRPRKREKRLDLQTAGRIRPGSARAARSYNPSFRYWIEESEARQRAREEALEQGRYVPRPWVPVV